MKACTRSMLLVLLAAMGGAQADDAQVIHSCAGGQPIRFAAGDSRALLDETDRRLVHAAMLARYPMLQRDGFAPAQILLWRRAPEEWLYVSLAASPQRPGEACFTATFAAAGFEFTPELERKYFFAGAART
jgi:hypothetical protein